MNINELTLEIIRSYANACRDLHDYLRTLQDEGFNLLVIPSRGAHPFFQTAKSFAYQLRSKQTIEYGPPRLFLLDTLYLPFTADIHAGQIISSSNIRQYWTHVLAAIINQNMNDTAYRFYEFLRGNAGDLAVGRSNIKNGFDGKFIFIDTVVSGRAISEIIDAFEKYGLTNCHFILIIDENGEKLSQDFSHKIDQLVQSNRATKIFVDNIFTEDQGPSMSGIWTVTMPDIVLAAEKMVSDFSNSGEIAATFFYWEIQKRLDNSNLAVTVSNGGLSTLLYSAVNGIDSTTELLLRDFQSHILDNKLQRQAITKTIANPLIKRNLAVTYTDVSSSHVIRAFMDKNKAERMVQEFTSY